MILKNGFSMNTKNNEAELGKISASPADHAAWEGGVRIFFSE